MRCRSPRLAAFWLAPYWIALVLTGASVVAGCGGPPGPERYDLSGAVTYRGKPVPKGYITFEPDTDKGNSGPGAAANIVDGKYATRPGQGTIGGPHIVTVSGFNGQPFEEYGVINPMGRPLFADHQLAIDLPKEAATKDLEVP
jgi:hypothetical protein